MIVAIGYWEEALEHTARHLNVEDILVVTYRAEQSFFDLFLGARTPLPGLRTLLTATTPRRLYLWRP